MARSLLSAQTIAIAGLFLTLLALPARAYHTDTERLLDFTAHNLDQGEFRLGLFSLDAGVLPWLSVGTDTLPWLAGVFTPMVMPNAHVKLTPVDTKDITLSFQVGLYTGLINSDDQSGAVMVVPVRVFASRDFGKDFSGHLELAYSTIEAFGDLEAESVEAGGEAITRTFAFGGMVEYRFTRVTAFFIRGRYLPFVWPVSTNANSQPDEDTEISGDAELTIDDLKNTWAVLAGVAFSWENINLRLGAGYGDLFLPSLGVVLPLDFIVPEVDFYVRF